MFFKDCALRPPNPGDLTLTFQWRNDIRVRRYMFTDHLLSMEEHRKWFDNITRVNPGTAWVFQMNKKPVGFISISNWDQRSNWCYWGFYLGETDLPRGTGTVMGFLALEEIFYTLSIRKVYGEVLDSNTPSIRMHQKLGFSQEGRFLEHILKGDTYVDVIRFAQDAKRWKEFKNKFWYNWGQ